MRHEWILTVCMVLAMGAVIAPLMLLMGLKHGTIATLRHKLVQDPVYREIRPAKTREYPSQWFQEFAARPEVGFLTPNILAASSIISVINPSTGRTTIYDLTPTAPGDPLILENGGRIPEGDQCVVTAAAADELGVAAGDTLKVRATRSHRATRQFGAAELEVAAVLHPRAGGLPRIYAPLPFVLDVESYKEGMAVPSRAWPGGTLRPNFSYDGIVLILSQPLSPVKESGLIINTGITTIARIDTETFGFKTGFPLPANLTAYDLRMSQNAVQFASYEALQNKLRGAGAILLPYAEGVQLEVSNGDVVTVSGLSLSSLQARVLGMSALPWEPLSRDAPNEKLLQILLPERLGRNETLTATFRGIGGTISFPMVNRGTSLHESAVVPAELVGILRTARQRKVTYEEGHRGFLLSRTGFRGFRLYTRSIDDVPTLTRELKKNGVEVIAQVEAIERVRILDRGLSRIFWLVAVVGIAGGLAALMASLYASVERKKQELSVMRLIGLSRWHVSLFPFYQGGSLALLSMAAAMSAYFLLAAVINHVFADDLEMGERICTLPGGYLAIVTAATVAVSLMGSLLAAWRTTHIDPAEALRYE